MIFNLIYLVLFLLASPLLLVAGLFRPLALQRALVKLWPKSTDMPPKKGLRLWLHAASVGEVNLALRLMSELEEADDSLEFFLTCNTPTGLEIAQRKEGLSCQILPFDFTFLLKPLIRRIGPDHLILIETELWPNLIDLMAKRGKVLIANGRLSDRHFARYRKGGFWVKPMLEKVALVMAGDRISRERFLELGLKPERVGFEGNFKFSLPPIAPTNELEELKATYSLGSEPLLVAGSIQPEETPVILKAFCGLAHDEARLILVPRHPEKREDFLDHLRDHEIGIASTGANRNARILLIDQIGVLRHWYQLATAVFVGGSLTDRGGQNMIEPTGYGKPTAIGPHTANFQREVALLQEALFVVSNAPQIKDFFQRALTGELTTEAAKGKELVQSNAGALGKSAKVFLELLRS